MIQAISGDAKFVQMVRAETFGGFIHSVFNSVINIQCSADGELYSLATFKIDNAPNTIRVENECFDRSGIKAGDQVSTAANCLKIGKEVVVSLVKITQWQGMAPAACHGTDIQLSNLKVVRTYLEQHGVAGGMKPSADGNSFSVAMSEMLQSASNLLIDDLARGDMPAALDHAVGLIGLGIGLTPSGDDFLVGLLAVLSTEESPRFERFCAGIGQRAHGATNAISYMAIKKASEGLVRETIVQLLHSLRTDRGEHLLPAIRNVLMIGATSGTDIAWGIIRGFELVLKTGGQGYGTQSCH